MRIVPNWGKRPVHNPCHDVPAGGELSVCAYACDSVCVCVCVREREREGERERECVCVYAYVCVFANLCAYSIFMCIWLNRSGMGKM